MQGVFDACKQSILATTQSCLGTLVYKKPCLVLSRYVAKVALLLSEVELQIHINESLGGSQAVFLAGEGLCAALQQAESLTRQCCETGKARIWPLEDAIEFQSVALELMNAVSGLASSNIPLPEDVRDDISHFQKQLQALQFTEDDLEESENVELKEFQTEAVKYSNTATGHVSEPEPETQPQPSTPVQAPGEGNILPSKGLINKPLAEPAAPTPGPAAAAAEEPTTPPVRQQPGSPASVPAPDKGIMEVLDKGGAVYVNLDNSSATAMPPEFPTKDTVQSQQNELTVHEAQGKDAAGRALPADPFSMDAERKDENGMEGRKEE